MARTPPIVKKRDLRNAVEAVVAAGIHVARVEIIDGKITVIAAPEAEAAPTATPESQLLEAIHDRRKAPLRHPKA